MIRLYIYNFPFNLFAVTVLLIWEEIFTHQLIQTNWIYTSTIIGHPLCLHADKSFRNLIKSTRNQIVYTIFQLLWNRTDFRLIPNQLENGIYNLISVWFDNISKKFLCVLRGFSHCSDFWIWDRCGGNLIFPMNKRARDKINIST